MAEHIFNIIYITILLGVSGISLYGVFAFIKNKDKPSRYALVLIASFALGIVLALEKFLTNYYYIGQKYINVLETIIWILLGIFYLLVSIFALTKEYVYKRQRLWVRISIAYLTLMAIGVLLVFCFY